VSTRRAFSWALLLATLALALSSALSAFGQGSEKLFFIQRSKNEHEIHYDANLTADGKLDPKHPVDGYWMSKTATGWERSDITLLQRIAYGFDVEPAADGAYAMKLKAFPDRTLMLVQVDGKWRARTMIDGKRAYLTRLYVATDESGVMPKVLYVEVFGETVSGKPVQEHIVKN
jgi:Domain of unknown function (DUF4833)